MVSGHFTRNLCRPRVHVNIWPIWYRFYAPGKTVVTLFIVAGGSLSDVFYFLTEREEQRLSPADAELPDRALYSRQGGMNPTNHRLQLQSAR
jgi:hypothetical protein